MRIVLMDRAVFAVVSSVSVKELRKEHPEWDGRRIKKQAKPCYLKMLQETPEIGSYSENCLKICLTGGAVWFSVYEAVEELYGKMSDELYGRMCNATYSIPIMARKYRKMPFFDAKFQDKYAAKMEKVLKIKSDSNWTPNYGKGAPDYSTMRFTTCGLCALAKRTGHHDILPIMCSTDYTVAKLMGVNLHRDKTLATGDACCDYLYTRPGSEIEKKWQAEHPEGTFHSK
ncbi:MAG: L-2-amino-thiazoline-4-carboxylic acid hydrolase [Bacteroidales bacterium]|nr:L-2-amino-thiazoline-4-carboxylic acid hydrolase [Bacteroidales bacterium]